MFIFVVTLLDWFGEGLSWKVPHVLVRTTIKTRKNVNERAGVNNVHMCVRARMIARKHRKLTASRGERWT